MKTGVPGSVLARQAGQGRLSLEGEPLLACAGAAQDDLLLACIAITCTGAVVRQ